LAVGFLFTWLSRGNYLENRKQITQFLKTEKLENVPLKYYIKDEKNLDEIKIAELISTVNPRVTIAFKPKNILRINLVSTVNPRNEITLQSVDTLANTTLTEHKVLSKVKIIKNKYQ
jgi:hypothetical protein